MHTHPGRCFLAGLDDADPLIAMLGAAEVAAAGLTAVEAAALTMINLSTAADLRVLAPDPVRGLRAARQLKPREAHADRRRELDGSADRWPPSARRWLSPPRTSRAPSLTAEPRF